MSRKRGRGRGQLVLLAAVAIAVALVPLLLAYLQLGYTANVAGPEPNRAADTERTLSHALGDASRDVPPQFDWHERDQAVTTVRTRLAPTLAARNSSGVTQGVAQQVTYNETRAHAWASANCPTGPGREFGACVADRGVVVQERAGETHVLAVAFDVRIVTADGESRLQTVVEPPGA